MKKIDQTLDDFVKRGSIKSYHYSNEESEKDSGMREYEILGITLLDGTILHISTWCSGTAENTGLYIGEIA